MTYKYYDIRREIYENCSDKPLKRFRTFSEMKKIFKFKFWIVFILMILCIIAMGILAIVLPNTYWFLIPIGILMLLSFIFEFQGENLYNPIERKKELDEQNECYDEYVNKIVDVLNLNGLYSKNQWKSLKEECKNRLESYEITYRAISDKAYNVLIGVPLGALISSLIYKNNEATTKSIIGLIVIGIVVILFVRMCKKIRFYTDGYFKDRYLLCALNELDYYNENNYNNLIKGNKLQNDSKQII